MGKILHTIVAAVMLTAAFTTTGVACTSFIVSAKASKSGRPMIFKNRDTGNLDNCIVEQQGEKYKYVAVVSASDTKPQDVWSGHNEAGFAIINTAAYNLNGDITFAEDDEHDGIVMRRALEVCASLADFEHLLDTIKTRNVNSNYGVIDAHGGCAYYETGLKQWKKFDANDPNIAPYGYLVRTNHGYSGDRSMDLGTERYLAMSRYMERTALTGAFDAQQLVRRVPRILTHGLTNVNLYDLEPDDNAQPKFAHFIDFIPRFSTSAAQLIEGVKEGEAPTHTVAWTIIGSPLATVAMPLVISPSGRLPEVVQRGSDGGSQLCHYGLKLKEKLFPLRTKSRSNYIDVGQLINRRGTGILQQIEPIEDQLMSKAATLVDELRTKDAFPTRLFDEYYKWTDTFVRQQYNERFGL